MLTNIELILLKFIREKPSYAYEIERRISERGIRNWVKIGGPTVYQVLDRLYKKGILQVSWEKEGKMPQRRRYSLTTIGQELAQISARKPIGNIETYYFDLTVGLACRFFLSEEEGLLIIQERLDKLNIFIRDFDEEFNKARELYPDKRLLVRRYLLSHYKLEQQFLQELLKDEEHQK